MTCPPERGTRRSSQAIRHTALIGSAAVPPVACTQAETSWKNQLFNSSSSGHAGCSWHTQGCSWQQRTAASHVCALTCARATAHRLVLLCTYVLRVVFAVRYIISKGLRAALCHPVHRWHGAHVPTRQKDAPEPSFVVLFKASTWRVDGVRPQAQRLELRSRQR